MSDSMPLLSASNLKKYYRVRSSRFSDHSQVLKAVDDVSFKIYPGEAVGLVGESGCGKSTTGRILTGMTKATGGEVIYRGRRIENLKESKMRQFREQIQIIFQDPYSALNPRMTIYDSVMAPLDAFHRGDKTDRGNMVRQLLRYVGIEENQFYKYPHEMSGGQRQRVVIARALVIHPDFIVADEPVSALDVSVRAQILNLLKKMKYDFQLSYLFISHDMSTVRFLCDEVMVMYLGKIVEKGPAEEIFMHPCHPYTQALVSAIPIPEIRKKQRDYHALEGDIPSPVNPPKGCRFCTRCLYATAQCREEAPDFRIVSEKHECACFRVGV